MRFGIPQSLENKGKLGQLVDKLEFKGSVNVGLFLTMNTNEEYYNQLYKDKFEAYAEELKRLNGDVCIYPCYNTLQVADYSKFSMNGFSEAEKRKVHEEQFPVDLQKAYEIGTCV